MAENQTVGFRWPTINQLRDWPPETRGTNFAPLRNKPGRPELQQLHSSSGIGRAMGSVAYFKAYLLRRFLSLC